MDKKHDTKKIGNLGENIAEKYLKEKWYEILAKNFVVYGGEIDLIAKKDEIIIFVEVKMRKNEHFSHPVEVVTPAKIRSILRAMYDYMDENSISDENVRLDIIGILPKSQIEGGGYNLTHIKWIEIPEIQ